MAAGILQQAAGRIETHRLGIEQRQPLAEAVVHRQAIDHPVDGVLRAAVQLGHLVQLVDAARVVRALFAARSTPSTWWSIA